MTTSADRMSIHVEGQQSHVADVLYCGKYSDAGKGSAHIYFMF